MSGNCVVFLNWHSARGKLFNKNCTEKGFLGLMQPVRIKLVHFSRSLNETRFEIPEIFRDEQRCFRHWTFFNTVQYWFSLNQRYSELIISAVFQREPALWNSFIQRWFFNSGTCFFSADSPWDNSWIFTCRLEHQQSTYDNLVRNWWKCIKWSLKCYSWYLKLYILSIFFFKITAEL